MFSLHSKIALTNRHTILIKLAYLQGYDKYLISTRVRTSTYVQDEIAESRLQQGLVQKESIYILSHDCSRSSQSKTAT